LAEVTVHRHWRFVRAWLKLRIDGDEDEQLPG
jgi:hypothetical protein